MQEQKADYTNTFKDLTLGDLTKENIFQTNEFKTWYKRWTERLDRQQQSKEEIKELMENNNPVVIPRNHRVEEALESATNHGDLTVLEKLLEVISKPYDYQNINDKYTLAPPATNQCYKTYCGT